MEQRFYLGIDNGGALAQAVLFDAAGHEVAQASESVPPADPRAGLYRAGHGGALRRQLPLHPPRGGGERRARRADCGDLLHRARQGALPLGEG